MTNPLNPDCATFKTGALPFAPGELDRSGLRLTRAEFARFLGVSKQAVGEWAAAGKITLGTDGRLDPRQAVSQLLRNSNPARLRAKVLVPLMRDIGGLQKRVADLEADLAAAKDDVEFHEGASVELVAQWNTLDRNLCEERDVLALLPADKVIAAIIAWMSRVAFEGSAANGLAILDCVPDHDELELTPSALNDEKGGGGIAPLTDDFEENLKGLQAEWDSLHKGGNNE